MNIGKALLSGLAGAVTLTAIKQGMSAVVKDSPKVELLSQKGIKRIYKQAGFKKPNLQTRNIISITGNFIINTLYYSLSAISKKPVLTGVLLGTGAGTGTIASPRLLAFGTRFVAKNTKQKALTMLVYLAGGLAAAGTYKALEA